MSTSSLRSEITAGARIVVVIITLPFLLRVLALPTLLNVLAAGSRQRTGSRISIERAASLTKAFLHVLMFRDTCLKRSLVLFHVLRKSGYDAQVIFGVRNTEFGLRGHAWLKVDGHIVNEPGDPATEFKAIYSFPT
jgi:hypothetical protein